MDRGAQRRGDIDALMNALDGQTGGGVRGPEMAEGPPAEEEGGGEEFQLSEQMLQLQQENPVLFSVLNAVDQLEQQLASIQFVAMNNEVASDKAAQQFIEEWMNTEGNQLRKAGWSYLEMLDSAYAAYVREQGASEESEEGEAGLKPHRKAPKADEEAIMKAASNIAEGIPDADQGSHLRQHQPPAKRMERALKLWQRNASKK